MPKQKAAPFREAHNPQQKQRPGCYYTPPGAALALATWVLKRITKERHSSPATLSILEPSCGEGALLWALLSEMEAANITPKDTHITGIDVDATAIDTCKRTAAVRYPTVRFETLHADALIDYAAPIEQHDIVIGNPPYLRAQRTGYLDAERRKEYRERYPMVQGAFDPCLLFIEQLSEWLKPGGVFGYILPRKLLAAQYARPVLEKLKALAEIHILDVSDRGYFPTASVYPIFIVGQMRTDTSLTDTYTKPINIRHKATITAPKTLAEYGVKMRAGAAGFQAQRLAEALTESPLPDTIPFIVSGCIAPYQLSYSPVRFMGRRMERAFVPKHATTDANFAAWQKPRILIAGMTKRIEAVWVSEPVGLGIGVYAIDDFGVFDPFFLLGALNSTTMSRILRQNCAAKVMRGGYIAFNKHELLALPLPLPPPEQQNTIAYLAERITNHATQSEAFLSMLKEIDSIMASILPIGST